MNCPYCECEMTKGKLLGDGRTKVRWKNEDEKINWIDKMFTRKGCVEAYYSIMNSQFTISGHYCEKCEKIIINAKPEK